MKKEELIIVALCAVMGLPTFAADSISAEPVSANGQPCDNLMNNLKIAASYSAKSNGVSMLVMQNGKVVFEEYPNGHSTGEAHELASGTKSFSGVAALAAQEDGILSLDEPVSATITEWKNDPQRKDITIRQLLTLTSGIEGKILKPPPYADSVSSAMTAAPGTKFQYGAAPFQIFGELMCRKLKKKNQTMVDYLKQRVLEPAGIHVDRWRCGADGMPYIPQGAGLTAREWGKFGEFILEGGKAAGKQIMSPEDLKTLFVGTEQNPMYGLTWWLNRPIDESLRKSIRTLTMSSDLRYGEAGVPDDLVMAAGAGKQRLYVIPSRNMIIVRQADRIGLAMLNNDETGFSDNAFLQLVFLGKSEYAAATNERAPQAARPQFIGRRRRLINRGN